MTASRSPDVSRRNLLASMGTFVGGAVLLNHTVAQDNPAAQVTDSASSIRITGLKTHRVQHKVYVEILTSNKKIIGWGEVSALVPTAAEELAKALFELLDGENPTRIEHIWQKIYRAHRDIRGGPFMVHTLAGIDMALWDITSKLWNVPVYRLLNGPTRDKIRVYPSDKSHKAPPGGVYEHGVTQTEHVDHLVDQAGPVARRSRRSRDVRRPLRHSAVGPDPVRLAGQGV